MSWLDWPCLFYWLTEWLNPIYLMVADFMRYYTRIKISHDCRFHEILKQNQNISWLQISWDITPESKYLMVADFMRYYFGLFSLFVFLSLVLCPYVLYVCIIVFMSAYHISKSIYLIILKPKKRYGVTDKPNARDCLLWDIAPRSQYLIIVLFMRYYTMFTIYHI